MAKQVLILDDDKNVLDVLEEVLSYSDYDVKVTQTAAELFLYLENKLPDIILLDYILPGTNGGKICAKIKKDPQTATIPIIIISAYPQLIMSMEAIGCDAIIAKPFNLPDLLIKINHVFNINRVNEDEMTPI